MNNYLKGGVLLEVELAAGLNDGKCGEVDEPFLSDNGGQGTLMEAPVEEAFWPCKHGGGILVTVDPFGVFISIWAMICLFPAKSCAQRKAR